MATISHFFEVEFAVHLEPPGGKYIQTMEKPGAHGRALDR